MVIFDNTKHCQKNWMSQYNSSVECKRVARAFWRFFIRSIFLFYNKMWIENNFNLILDGWKVIGLYLKLLTIC